MICVAIYGPTCVGKSTVACLLADHWECPVRHCGSLLRAFADSRQLRLEDLTYSDHHAFDEMTRAVIQQNTENLIVEGRYLDAVLDGISVGTMVNLTCHLEERVRRHCNQSIVALHDVSEIDAADAALRRRLYLAEHSDTRPAIEIDTTSIAPTDVVNGIINAVIS